MKFLSILIDLAKYLLFSLILLIPLTHKEMFSILDKDLVWSRFVFALIAIIGVVLVIKERKKLFFDPFFALLLIILGFHTLSLFQSKNLYESVRMILFIFTVTFSYPVFQKYISLRADNLTSLIKLYLLSFFGVILFLVFQIYMQENFGVATGGVWPVPKFSTRFGSTFWDVNHFGAYLSSFIFMISGFVLSRRKDKVSILKLSPYLLSIPLALLALYFTASRSALLGFTSGFVVFTGLFLSSYKKGNFFVSKSNHHLWTKKFPF